MNGQKNPGGTVHNEQLQPRSCLEVDQSGLPGEQREALSRGEAAAARSAVPRSPRAARGGVSAPPIAEFLQGQACTRASRSLQDIRSLVIHTPEGHESATLDVLNGTRASFDFYLPLSGTLYQCNNFEEFIAWQAGDWTYNQRSIGIEQGDFAANSGDFTEEHYRRLAHLVAWLIQQTSTPLRYATDYGEDGLIDHATITPATRSDPGAGFRRDLLMQLVHEILEAPEEDPAVIEQLQNQIRDLEAQLGEKDRRLMDVVSSLGYVSGDVAAALDASAGAFIQAVTPLEGLDSSVAEQARQQVLDTVENGLRPIVNTLRGVQPPG